MRPSRRSFLTTTGAVLLARSALQDAPSAHAETTLPGEAQPRRTSFGINLHIDRFPPATAFLQLAHAKAAGVQSIRGLAAAFADILPSPGGWQFAKSDRDLDFMQTHGFDIYGGLGYGAAWASVRDPNQLRNPRAWSKYPPDDLKVWEEYVNRTISRYRGRVHSWSPWNEPDSFGFFIPMPASDGKRDEAAVAARRGSYLDLQKITYLAAKRADPTVTLLSGGFAMGGDYDRGFLPWLIDNGLLDHCDVLEIHTYWSIKNLEDVINRARELMRKAGKTRPIWVTEFGAALKSALAGPNIGSVEHDHIANMIPKALATALAFGVERFYWYQGYTEASAAVPLSNSEYSLSVTDGPTPAFWSFAATARLLRDAEYVGPANLQVLQGAAKGYLFKRVDGEVAILWAVSPDGLDNKSASAQGRFNWRNQTIPIQLSERPTVMVA
jgi:Glycosyl hydrolase catalytic core